MSIEHSLPTSLHYPPKAMSVSAESSKNVFNPGHIPPSLVLIFTPSLNTPMPMLLYAAI